MLYSTFKHTYRAQASLAEQYRYPDYRFLPKFFEKTSQATSSSDFQPNHSHSLGEGLEIWF